MALTRSFLRSLKLDEETVSAIIEAHSETVDGLKNVQNDLQAQLDAAKEALTAEKNNEWEKKYNELSESFESYKSEQAAKDTRSAKEKAYTAILKKAGVTNDKHISAIIKVTDIDGIELDDEGNAKDEKNLTKSIKEDYAGFITTRTVQGAKVDNPPAASGSTGTMTRAQIMAIKDRDERLEAIRANPDAFNTNVRRE